jgi:hypothetical protein
MKDQDAAYLAISDAMPSLARQPERMMVSYPSTTADHEAIRRDLTADVEAYLASGGKITEIPAGVTSESIKEEV